uniref:Uncharacterized protein n=1 Tax=Xenopus tropicalis TaxID=8364 RepID=A0A1B8Y1Y1_XENTR
MQREKFWGHTGPPNIKLHKKKKRSSRVWGGGRENGESSAQELIYRGELTPLCKVCINGTPGAPCWRKGTRWATG